MHSTQLKIARAMRWFFWAGASLIVGAFAWDIFAGQGSSSTSRLSEGVHRVGGTFGLVVVLVAWVAFAALLLEFLRREISGIPATAPPGRVLLAIRRPMLVTAIVPLVGAFVLAVLMNLTVFRSDRLAPELDGFGLDALLAFWLLYGVGHFLLVVFALRAVRNRPVLVLTEQGFRYEPGDLSPGLVRWNDIERLTEADLLSGDAGRGASILRRTLVVSLRNRETYRRRYNPLLRLLQRWAMQVVEYQVDGSADMVLRQGDLDPRYGEVKALMAEHVAKAGGSVALL